jgi:hypothetical protein
MNFLGTTITAGHTQRPRGRALPALAGIVLATVTLGLSGCSQAAGPSVEKPTLETVQPATSPLEADKFVSAARAADLGRALAWNALDFTLSDLTSTNSARTVENQYDTVEASYVNVDGSPQVRPGPDIWLPVDVTPNAAGDGADIVVCRVQKDWILSADHAEATFEITDGRLYTQSIVTDEASGRLVYDGDSPEPGDDCDATGAPVERFTPVPEIPKEITEGDITKPASVD